MTAAFGGEWLRAPDGETVSYFLFCLADGNSMGDWPRFGTLLGSERFCGVYWSWGGERYAAAAFFFVLDLATISYMGFITIWDL